MYIYLKKICPSYFLYFVSSTFFHFLLPCIKLNQTFFYHVPLQPFIWDLSTWNSCKHCPLLNLLMVWYLITSTKLVLNYPISCATTNFTNRWKQVTVCEGACHILECQNIFGRLRPATTFLEMFSNQTDMLIFHWIIILWIMWI